MQAGPAWRAWPWVLGILGCPQRSPSAWAQIALPQSLPVEVWTLESPPLYGAVLLNKPQTGQEQ